MTYTYAHVTSQDLAKISETLIEKEAFIPQQFQQSLLDKTNNYDCYTIHVTRHADAEGRYI